MLILEGSDCLGKTTFAKLLSKKCDALELFPTFYSHMSRPNSVFDFFKHYKDMMTRYAIQDRFHLGGIVWHDAISQAQLDIIEGWLHSIGSITVIFYTSDHKWYKERIKNDERGNLLSVETMCVANNVYKSLADDCYIVKSNVNYFFDIKGPDEVVHFPDKMFADMIIKAWFKRLKLLENL